MSTATHSACATAKSYPHLQGLAGISAEQLESHFKLYQGYVANVNTLVEKLTTLTPGSPEWAEIKRRLGFEVNGVVMHDLYFENMTPNGGPLPAQSRLAQALTAQFGSVENWEADFKATGKMRGIGWAVLYQCRHSGKLANFWIGEHENGHPANGNPILIMDVWEHAYVGDYKPTERPAYIDAFFNNIHWQVAESRLI